MADDGIGPGSIDRGGDEANDGAMLGEEDGRVGMGPWPSTRKGTNTK